MDIFKGWKKYRKHLNSCDLKPNQINFWNGQWIKLMYEGKDPTNIDLEDLVDLEVIEEKKDITKISGVTWTDLFFSMSGEFPNDTMMVYVYSLGQTNQTYGFIPFDFKKGNDILINFEALYGNEDIEVNKKMFGSSFYHILNNGYLDLSSFQPKDIYKYLGNSETLNLSKPKIKIKKNETEEEFEQRKLKLIEKDNNNLDRFRTYQTYLLSIMKEKKEEIISIVKELAEALYKFEANDKKTKRKNLIDHELLSAKSTNPFIRALVEVISEVKKEDLEIFYDIKHYVDEMSQVDFTYFTASLKFELAYLRRTYN